MSNLPRNISYNIELPIEADCQVEDVKIYERRQGKRITKPQIISALAQKALKVNELIRQGKADMALAKGVREIFKA